MVGHRLSMDATHYGRKLREVAREAVDGMPPVDWTGPERGDNVVPLQASSQ